MQSEINFSASKILFYICLSFIFGIFSESLIKIPHIVIWGILFLGIVIIIFDFFYKNRDIFLRPPNPRLGRELEFSELSRPEARKKIYPYFCFVFCFLFLVLGILRVQISEFSAKNDAFRQFNEKEAVVFEGFISDEPDVRENSQKIKVKTGDSTVLITTGKYPEYGYLDRVKITGKLETPMENEDFSYKNYLAKDGIYSTIGFPKIEVLGKENGNVFSKIYLAILVFKEKLRASISKNILPPQGSVLKAIILGDKSSLSIDIKDSFKNTGVSHIIAVSGMHIVILSTIIISVLLFFGFWRKQAFCFAIIFIVFYVVLVGLPPSGIRAGIMAIIYLSGQFLGRQTMTSRIVVLAAALMLLQNPLLLFYDVGFQLSFMAVLGLIYFEPLLKMFLKFLIEFFKKTKIEEKYESSLSVFTATLAAQIFTLPILIYNFGKVSYVSPVANILLIPFIYYLMFFGFLSAVAGVFWAGLGWIISVPCYFVMSYFLWVVNLFNRNWAYAVFENVHWAWPIFLYFFIFFATWYLNRRFLQKLV